MKKIYLLLSCCLCCLFFSLFLWGNVRTMNIVQTTGDTLRVEVARIDSLRFSPDGRTVYLSSKGEESSYPTNLIKSVYYQTIREDTIPIILWTSDTTVQITNPYEDVSITAQNGHVVVIDSSNSNFEHNYYCSGSSDSGSLTIYSVHPFSLYCDNLTLHTYIGPAILSHSSERMTINVPLGSYTDLMDQDPEEETIDNDTWEGTIHSKGSVILRGLGSLTINGIHKHGIYSESKVTILPLALNILDAISDAIHAEDSIVLDGGKVNTMSRKDGLDGNAAVVLRSGSLSCFIQGEAACGIKSNQNVIVENCSIKLSQFAAYKETEESVSFSHAIKADSLIEIKGGVVTINSFSEGGRGLSSKKDIRITNGEVEITMSGDGGIIADKDTFTTFCIKADRNIYLLGGTITLTANGSIGTRGLYCKGNLQIGNNDNNDPIINITTQGGPVYQHSDGKDAVFTGAPKAIHSYGPVTMYNGLVTINTEGAGGEGIESESSINLQGGYLFIHSIENDAINSAGIIKFSGAIVYACSNGNDAIDSNYGQEGAIAITGGIVIALSGSGSPEEAIDCDDISFLTLSGGHVFTAGGTSGNNGQPQQAKNIHKTKLFAQNNILPKATQTYGIEDKVFNLAKDSFYAVFDDKNNILFAFRSEIVVNSAFSIISSSAMEQGKTYKVCKIATSPINTTRSFENHVFLNGEGQCDINLFDFVTQ